MDIEQLVISASAGDKRAFEQLTAALAPKLCRWFKARFGDLDSAELTQLTMIVVWQKLPRFQMQHDGGFSAWLFKIAWRIGMTALRVEVRFADAPKVLEPILGAPRTGRSTLEERERRLQRLRFEIERLPQSLRLAAQNRLMGGNAKDLAEQLGIEWATVRAYETRAIEQLRRRLRPSTPDSTPT
ncbi:MAG: RNA polymerase sigma factor [Enhygromyxa sp.]